MAPGIGAMLLAPVVHSAGLEVTPTTLQLPPSQKAVGIWLNNASDIPIRAQIRVFAWTQEDHHDLLASSSAIVVSPPMLQLAPGGKQLVRVIRTKASGASSEPAHEAAYRLIIDELPVASTPPSPQARSSPPRTELAFLMRYSVPVFVGAPPSPSPQARAQLRWTVDQSATHWTFTASNSGNTHAQIADLNAVAADDTRLPLSKGLVGYVLAGQEMRWRVPAPDSPQPIVRYEAMINRTTQALNAAAH